MSIMTHAKFHLNQLMLILIFGIWAQRCKQLKWLGLIGLTLFRPGGHLAHPQRKILITTELVQVSNSYFVTFPKI